MHSANNSPVFAQKTSNRTWTLVAGLFTIKSPNAVKNYTKVISARILVKLDLRLTHFLSFDSLPLSFKSSGKP